MRSCPHCAKSIGDDAKECVFCGASVDAAPAAPRIAEPPVAAPPVVAASDATEAPPSTDAPAASTSTPVAAAAAAPATAPAPPVPPPPPPAEPAAPTATIPRPSTAGIPGGSVTVGPPIAAPSLAPTSSPARNHASMIVAGLVVLVAVIGAVMFLGSHGSAPSVSSSLAPTAEQLARDHGAQADLRNALVAAKTLYTDHGTYAGSTAVRLASVEPALCYVGAATPSTASGATCRSGHGHASVSVYTSRHVWAAARMSASGTCFWIRDDDSHGTTYGAGATCTGAAAREASGTDFPGTASAATTTSRCVDMSKLTLFAKDAVRSEHRANTSVTLSGTTAAIARAASDWREVSRTLVDFPRLAAPFRAAAAKLDAASRALARGENARAHRLSVGAIASLHHARHVMDVVAEPPHC